MRGGAEKRGGSEGGIVVACELPIRCTPEKMLGNWIEKELLRYKIDRLVHSK